MKTEKITVNTKNNSTSDDLKENSINENVSQVTKSEKIIKTSKYKYEFYSSNTNNKNDCSKSSNSNNINNKNYFIEHSNVINSYSTNNNLNDNLNNKRYTLNNSSISYINNKNYSNENSNKNNKNNNYNEKRYISNYNSDNTNINNIKNYKISKNDYESSNINDNNNNNIKYISQYTSENPNINNNIKYTFKNTGNSTNNNFNKTNNVKYSTKYSSESSNIINNNNYINNKQYQSKYIAENPNFNNINSIKTIPEYESENITNNNLNDDINNNDNNNVNKGKISSSENILINSPSKLKCNYETNYTINKSNNIKYVNGSNKIISEKNYIRSPDIILNNKNDNIIKKTDNNTLNEEEAEEKYLNYKNSENRIDKNNEDNQLYEEKEIITINEGNNNNNNLGDKKKIIKGNYYIIDNNDNNKDINNKHKIEKQINVETYPLVFIDDDIKSKSKLEKNENLKNLNEIKNNTSIEINKHCNTYYDTYEDFKNKRIENLKMKNINNLNIYEFNKKNDNTKKNHRFKSISNCSHKDIYHTKKTNSIFSQHKERNESTDTNRKYKYNIKIHNINVVRGMNRSVSYENLRNRNRRNLEEIYSLEEYNKNYNIESTNRSFDKEDLKMQNAQNMQVLQRGKKLLQILVPIPPNEIDYPCGLQINGSSKKKYTLEEINEIRKRKKMIEETEIIKKKAKEKENLEKQKIIKINKSQIKKPNWNETNEFTKTNKISIENTKKDENKINNLKEKNLKKPKKLDIENFAINIADNGRKFRGEMTVENNSIKYEKKPKDPNTKLLLSPNQRINLKAEYPKRDWNNITKPISGRPLSIEKKNKPVLMERSVEKLSLRANSPRKDWNKCNNERKEVNINLYENKKKPYLSKERVQPFEIIGKEKDWNIITSRESESKLTIKGINKKEIENEEDLLINDDYNIIPKNRKPILIIKKLQDNPDESISSEIDVLKNLKTNEQNNKYKEMILDSMRTSGQERRVIINDISKKYPKRIETYHGKDEEEGNIQYQKIIINTQNQEINNIGYGKNINNNGQIPENIIKSNLYYKKVINHKRNQSSPLIQLIPETNFQNGIQNPLQETKYYYREIITTTGMENNFEKEQNYKNEKLNYNNNLNNNNINNLNQYSEPQTPKSRVEYSYREEIITLSPNRSELQTKSNYKTNTNNSLNNSESITYNMNEFIKNGKEQNNNIQNQYKYNNQNLKDSNINKNKIPTSPQFSYSEKTEQEIPKIQDESHEIIDDNNYNEKLNEENQGQPQVQYIFRNIKKSSNSNMKKNSYNQIIDKEIKREDDYKNINNCSYIPNYKNNFQKFDQLNQIQNEQIDYNVYSLGKVQTNTNTLEENQNFKDLQNLESSQENNININQSNQMHNIQNIIVNEPQLIETNNLNNYNNKRQIEEVSKSQEFQSSSPTPSQRLKKYPQLIQNFSHHLMTNPSDNYNGFDTNKLNIIPMPVGKNNNLNININNISNGERQYFTNIIDSQNNLNNMNDIDFNKSSKKTYSGENPALNISNRNSIKSDKVKILKY